MANERHMHILTGVLLFIFHLCTMTLINETLSTFKPRQTQCPCEVISTSVYCSNRSLDSIPSCIPADVTYLDLRYNGISHIKAFTFAGLHKLSELYLGANNLTTITRLMFANLTNVKILSLSVNRIYHIEDSAFAGMHSLTELYLHANDLKTITRSVFVNLRNVKLLRLSGNSISQIEDFAFAGMHSLTELYLHANNLKTITRSVFVNLTNVKLLDLRHNDLPLYDGICAFKHKDDFLLMQYPRKDSYLNESRCSCYYINIQRQIMSDCTSMTQTNLTSILWNNSSFCSTLYSSIMPIRCQESEVNTHFTYRSPTIEYIKGYFIQVAVFTVIPVLIAIGVSVLAFKRGWLCFAKRSQDIQMSAVRAIDADEGRPTTGSKELSDIYDEIEDALEDFASVSLRSNMDDHVKEPDDSVFKVELEPEVHAAGFLTPNSRLKEEFAVSEDGKKYCEYKYCIITNTEIRDRPINVHSVVPHVNPESQEDKYLHAISDEKGDYLQAVSDSKDEYLYAVNNKKGDYLQTVSDEKEYFSHLVKDTCHTILDPNVNKLTDCVTESVTYLTMPPQCPDNLSYSQSLKDDRVTSEEFQDNSESNPCTSMKCNTNSEQSDDTSSTTTESDKDATL